MRRTARRSMRPIFSFDTYADFISGSSLVALGAKVMGWDAQYLELAGLLELVMAAFVAWDPGKVMFDLDFEYKLVVDDGLVVKQVREVPFASTTPSVPTFLVNQPVTYCIFQGEIGNVMGNHRLKSRWSIATRNTWLSENGMAPSILDQVEVEYRQDGVAVTLTGDPGTWAGAAYEAWNLENNPHTKDSWTTGQGADLWTWTLSTPIQMLASPAESPVKVYADFFAEVRVDYATPQPRMTQFNGNQTTAYDSTRFFTCPEDLEITSQYTLRDLEAIGPGGESVNTSYYWPPGPTGASAGYTANLAAAWVIQQLHEAFPWDTAPRYLILDRGVHGAIKSMGTKAVKTAYRSPWQNGVATTLDRVLPPRDAGPCHRAERAPSTPPGEVLCGLSSRRPNASRARQGHAHLAGGLILKSMNFGDGQPTLSLIDPATLKTVFHTDCACASARFALAVDDSGVEHLYHLNRQETFRYVVEKDSLTLDETWIARFDPEGTGVNEEPTSPVVIDGQVFYTTNTSRRSTTPMRVFWQDVNATYTPQMPPLAGPLLFEDPEARAGFSFSGLAADAATGIVFGNDQARGLVNAFRPSGDGEIEILWQRELRVSTGNTSVSDRQMVYFTDYVDGSNHLVVLDLLTGDELLRIPTRPPGRPSAGSCSCRTATSTWPATNPVSPPASWSDSRSRKGVGSSLGARASVRKIFRTDRHVEENISEE